MHKTRVTILGIVQTMGLRDKIKAVADGLGVCGTVENLRDGSVLLVCEAERPDIEEMVREYGPGPSRPSSRTCWWRRGRRPRAWRT